MAVGPHGHDSIVLGAWGCGAFHNDPEMIARLFKEALTGDLQGAYRHVVFAVTAASRIVTGRYKLRTRKFGNSEFPHKQAIYSAVAFFATARCAERITIGFRTETGQESKKLDISMVSLIIALYKRYVILEKQGYC